MKRDTTTDNSFAIPKKGSGFLKFINNKIKQFT